MSFSCTALTFPCEELHLDRKLVCREAERLLRETLVDARDLEEDLSGTDDRDPVVGRALTGAHPDLGRLLRDRLVREHADPDLSTTLEVVDDRAPRRLDLPRAHPARLLRLKGVVAERDRPAVDGVALHAATLELAVLEALRLQHYAVPTGAAGAGVAGATGATGAGAMGVGGMGGVGRGADGPVGVFCAT